MLQANLDFEFTEPPEGVGCWFFDMMEGICVSSLLVQGAILIQPRVRELREPEDAKSGLRFAG